MLASGFNQMLIHSRKDLIVWQKGIELSRQIYLLTEKFPTQTKNLSYQEIDILLNEISRMIMSMIKKLSIKASP